MDLDVKLLAEDGGCSDVGGDKEWVFLPASPYRYVKPHGR